MDPRGNTSTKTTPVVVEPIAKIRDLSAQMATVPVSPRPSPAHSSESNFERQRSPKKPFASTSERASSSSVELDLDRGYTSSNEGSARKGKLRKLRTSRSAKDLKKASDESPKVAFPTVKDDSTSSESSPTSPASRMRSTSQPRKMPSLKSLNLSFKSSSKSDAKKAEVPPVPPLPAYLPIAERFARSSSPYASSSSSPSSSSSASSSASTSFSSSASSATTSTSVTSPPVTPLRASKLSPEVWNDDKLWTSRITVHRSGSNSPTSASDSSGDLPTTPSNPNPQLPIIASPDDYNLDERGLQRKLQPSSFLSMSSTVYDPPKKSKKNPIRRFLVPITTNGFGFGSDKKSSTPPVSNPAKPASNRPISYLMVDTSDAQFAPMSWIEVNRNTVTIPEVFEDEPVPSSSFIVPSPTFAYMQQHQILDSHAGGKSRAPASMAKVNNRGRTAAFPQRPVHNAGSQTRSRPTPPALRDVARYRHVISKYYPAPPTDLGSLDEVDEPSMYIDEENAGGRFTIVSTAVSGEGWRNVMDETMSQLTRAEFLLAVGRMVEEDKQRGRI